MANLHLGNVRVFDKNKGKGVTLYYWLDDKSSFLGTLHTVDAYIKDGQLMFSACKRRRKQVSDADDYIITLMPSAMHHAIYDHYDKLMTYLMLKGHSHD